MKFDDYMYSWIAAKRIIKYITLISVVFIDQSREWDRNEKEPLVIYNVVVLFISHKVNVYLK